MARRKQVAPMRRINSGEVMQSVTKADEPQPLARYEVANGRPIPARQHKRLPSYERLRPLRPAPRPPITQPSVLSLIVCVSGIYASFLLWALLQERITTTPYAPLPTKRFRRGTPAVEYFKYSIFINTIQSLFAFLSGSVYLLTTTGAYRPVPSRAILKPLSLVTLTTTLASPFGYASLSHVDYLTFTLAKSCKLLPVMALHITLFNKRYPLSKYVIVLCVTAGVAIFTLYHPPKPSTKSKSSTAPSSSSLYGLALLGVNLLFDGLTNTVQDHIFSSPLRYGRISGVQMMVASNALGFLLQITYLTLTPYAPSLLLPSIAVKAGATTELSSALAFLQRHPKVLYDVLGFCAAGAIGQLFIFATLERFSSLVLVTVTVTRKMLTMVLSVVWYGKRLTGPQWGGVGLVFGGIGAEAYIAQQEKSRKEAERERDREKLKAK